MTHCVYFTLFRVYDKTHFKLKADRPHPRDNSAHRQTLWTDNDSSLLVAALGKAEVKRFSRERSDGRTDGQTDGRTLPSIYIYILRLFKVTISI